MPIASSRRAGRAALLPLALSALSMLTLVVSMASCASDPAGPPAELSALPRPLTAAEQRVLAAGNDFTWTLLRRVSAQQRGTSVVVSPLSASMALGMTMNGAAGATLDGMRTALGLGSISLDDANAGYQSSIKLLRGLDPTVEVAIANSIWYERTFPVRAEFVDAGTRWFDAAIRPLDFASPAAVGTINEWVRAATGGRIPTIVESTRDEVMYLLNAIYFKGRWRTAFDPAQTGDGEFRAADGTRQPARFMYRPGPVHAFHAPTADGVVLPYGNGAFAMTVLLPHDGVTADALAESIDGASWAAWQSAARDEPLDLYLPRFTIAYERTLNEDLAALGMGDALSPARADFSRLSSTSVYISQVKQKTWIQVNEEGTEAAGVTSVGVRPTSLPPSLRVDRPFVFVIHERLSGTVMFVGKVLKL